MSFDKDYQEFIELITDPEKSGSMGPVKYTKEEDAFAKLFAAYLNCRYPSAPPNHTMHSDGEGLCECTDHQGGPCSFCMEAKYNL